jgi:hypothetical protein
MPPVPVPLKAPGESSMAWTGVGCQDGKAVGEPLVGFDLEEL